MKCLELSIWELVTLVVEKDVEAIIEFLKILGEKTYEIGYIPKGR